MRKRTGTDEKKAKATYPGLLGLEPSRALARRLLVEAEEALRIFGAKALPLLQIGGYILSRDR